jgi:hypothetical protein
MNRGYLILLGAACAASVSVASAADISSSAYGMIGVNYGRSMRFDDLKGVSFTKAQLKDEGLGYELGGGFKPSNSFDIEFKLGHPAKATDTTTGKHLMEKIFYSQVVANFELPLHVAIVHPFIGAGMRWTKWKTEQAFDLKHNTTVAVGKHSNWSPVVDLGFDIPLGNQAGFYFGGTYNIGHKEYGIAKGYQAMGGITFAG